MKNFKFFLVLLLILSLVLAGCSNDIKTVPTTNDKIKVVATIYPVYEFARQVGGDRIQVEMLLVPGAEPHDWEPTPQDIIKIKSAKMFLYHGAGLEPVTRLLTKEVLGDVKAVEISQGVDLIKKNEDSDNHDKVANDDNHNHGMDVHTWLDPVIAQQEVATIAKAFIELDPQHKDYYQQNAQRYSMELAKLDQDYKAVLDNVKRRDIVTSHTAFGYLAKRYNLHQIGIMGLSPDSEPTPDKMIQVIEFCRKNNVRYIFSEPLVSPKLANAIARDTGASILVLNPLENLTIEDLKQGKNYLTVMHENLVNLEKALRE